MVHQAGVAPANHTLIGRARPLFSPLVLGIHLYSWRKGMPSSNLRAIRVVGFVGVRLPEGYLRPSGSKPTALAKLRHTLIFGTPGRI